MNLERYDTIIIGGGLAGLLAADRAENAGHRVVLIDSGIPDHGQGLGGFAPFSGAKFSLFPAGSGLAPLVGGEEALIGRYAQLCGEFERLGFPEFTVTEKQVAGRNQVFGQALTYRDYHSVLLTPARMAEFLKRLAARLVGTTTMHGRVDRLELGGTEHSVLVRDRASLSAPTVIVAAGRLGSALLRDAGLAEMRGKGIDIGIRLGFSSQAPLKGLRALGPDAKFMDGNVRTFCLNSPGRIFHYPSVGYQIPGGIVAEADWGEANVGVLCRMPDRASALKRLAAEADPLRNRPLAQTARGGDLGWTDDARAILGSDVIEQLEIFTAKLAARGLVRLPQEYQVHYPLLDWHWPVFSVHGRLATSAPGVFAAGDASGHARGLMQAALMGVLAVEEATS